MASANTKRSRKNSEHDLYNTDPKAVESAIACGVFDGLKDRELVLWDPCNGLGKISNTFQHDKDFAKARWLKSDLVKRTEDTTQLDFMLYDPDFDDFGKSADVIIINPPFQVNTAFIDKALELCDTVYVFNRISLLETQGRSSRFITQAWPLKALSIYSYRVGCTVGSEEAPTTKAVMYAWYEFSKKDKPLEIRWITEKKEEDLGL